MNDRGTFRAYGEQKRLNKTTLDIIHAANNMLNEYEARGHSMTVRQLYYKFVARGYTGGANNMREYERIQAALNTGRMQGLISWTSLEDRGRSLRGYETFNNTHECIRAARNEYKIDMWAGQQWRPEVWIEKEALSGVIGRICNRNRVDFFACRGYNSQSEQWRAGRRFANYVKRGQRPIVFHLGDHDPSGIDMTRDNQERLSMFAGVPIIVQRLALNMPQIEEFDPPPNPAKLTDSRARTYIEQYGDESWELDALEPDYIEKLIHDAIDMVRDPVQWELTMAQETADLAELDLFLEQFGATDDQPDEE